MVSLSNHGWHSRPSFDGAQDEGSGCGSGPPGQSTPFSKGASAVKVTANRNKREGGDPMSSGILQTARPLKLDHAFVGAASYEA